jgi:hypothetical protein
MPGDKWSIHFTSTSNRRVFYMHMFIKVYIFLILRCALPKIACLKVTAVNVLRGKSWGTPSAPVTVSSMIIAMGLSVNLMVMISLPDKVINGVLH